jgi:hypothetical protein
MLHTPNVDRLPVDCRRREVEGALGIVRQYLSAGGVEAVRAKQHPSLPRINELAALLRIVPATFWIATIGRLHGYLENNYAL